MQCILLYHAYDTMSSARYNHRPNATNMSIDQYKNACFHDYFCNGPDNINGKNDARSYGSGRWENKRPILYRKEPLKKGKTSSEKIEFGHLTRG